MTEFLKIVEKIQKGKETNENKMWDEFFGKEKYFIIIRNKEEDKITCFVGKVNEERQVFVFTTKDAAKEFLEKSKMEKELEILELTEGKLEYTINTLFEKNSIDQVCIDYGKYIYSIKANHFVIKRKAYYDNKILDKMELMRVFKDFQDKNLGNYDILDRIFYLNILYTPFKEKQLVVNKENGVSIIILVGEDTSKKFLENNKDEKTTIRVIAKNEYSKFFKVLEDKEITDVIFFYNTVRFKIKKEIVLNYFKNLEDNKTAN